MRAPRRTEWVTMCLVAGYLCLLAWASDSPPTDDGWDRAAELAQGLVAAWLFALLIGWWSGRLRARAGREDERGEG